MLAGVNLLLAVPAPGRAALPTCRPDPAYACDPRAFALIGRCVLKLCKGGRRAQTTDKGAVASRTADGEFLAGVGKRGNLAPAHGLPSPHKYDDAVRV